MTEETDERPDSTPSEGDENPYGLTLYDVVTASGSDLKLQTRQEAEWYTDRKDRYLTDNQFPNVSDLQDLDRLLMLEVLTYRWGLWMAQGFDYLYSRVDEGALKNSIREYSVETRLLKQALGIDKATRDKEKGESLSDYVAHLLDRAKVFGYHRNEEYEVVVTKFHELRAMIKTYDRCDDEERALLDLSHDSIIQWIRDKVITDFDQHAEAFRKEQAIWVRSM